jgi:PAS domain S-box-containing protein
VGDQLVAIGDLTYEAYRDDRRRVPFDGYGPGDSVPVTVLRNGQQRTVHWPMPAVTNVNRLSGLSGLLFYLPFWMAGTIVLLFLQPRHSPWRLLVAFNYLVAIWLAAGLASYMHVAASSLVTRAVSWLLVPITLHLHLLVPTLLLRRRSRFFLPPLYGISGIFAALELGQLLPDSPSYLFLFLAISASLALLVYRLFDRSSPTARSAALLMLAGVGLAFGPGLVLGLVPNLLSLSGPGGMAIAVALLAVPVLPLTYTYIIYKRHLGALEFRANRLLSLYSFILLGATLLVFAFLLGSQWIDFSGSAVLFSLGVSTVFIVVVSILRVPFQRLVDRLAYGAAHNPDEVIRVFANRIPAALSLEALAQLLTEEVTPSLLIRQSALCSLMNGECELVYASGTSLDDIPQNRQQVHHLLGEAGRYRVTPIATAESEHSAPGTFSWVRLVIPLVLREKTIGLWLFGRRDPDDYYPQDDIALLTTLADQVTVALENIRLYDQAQREIAERKQAELVARQERDRAQQYLDVAGVMLVALDQNGEIVLLNRRGYDILGYDEGTLNGRNWFDTCLPAHVRENARRLFASLLVGEIERTEAYTNPVLTKGGQQRIISWHNTILRAAAGQTIGTLSSGEDITERIQAEEARTRLIAAVEQTEEAVIILDDVGHIQYVNPAFEQITGYTPDDVLGQGTQVLDSGAHDTPYPELWRRLSRGEAWTGRLTAQKKGGSSYEAEVSISPVRDSAGQATEYAIILRDVTQQAALEAQLRQALKMEAIGQLAGGVAHDFNNLLTAIIGYTEFAASDVPAGSLLWGDLQEVLKAANRAASLTRQLLAFSRKQVLQPRVLDLNDVVTDMHKLLRRLIREDIELITTLDPDIGLVETDPGQLEQVVVNLVVNARDAMPQGGTLTVETANVDLDAAYARQHLDVATGPYVMLSVRDDGIGMSEQVRMRIFEPFFTTKEEGKGTGLGLATVYGIVKQSGGHIDVDSVLGMGTTFRIYLPRLRQDLDADEGQASPDALPRGTERILLVEDEHAVRRFVHRALELRGYTVLEAALPSQALQFCADVAGPIHLLLTDVVMPEMSGRVLADRVTALRPETKVLYMSGYTDDAIVHQGMLEPGVTLLQKPVTTSVLAHKVREILDGP